MAISVNELEAAFQAAFPAKAQAALARIVEDGYADAARICRREYDTPEGDDLLGHVRRAKIEGALRGVADAFSGMVADSKINTASNSHHVTIRSGNVLLTASRTEGIAGFPRAAVFRTLYAQSPQLDLLRPNDPPPELYVILHHCPNPLDESKPGAVGIGFPAPDGKEFIHNINLTSRLAQPAGGSAEGEPQPQLSETTPAQGSDV